ncbi:MAG: DUF1858 domain-containing protein [Magnetococcales bacterium]|nr:DUF1858 domain-containing protein [Magnetococcales bacterium]
MEIDLKKNMAELLQEFPQLGRILSERGIDCAACIAAQVDTLSDVARMYKLDMAWLLEQLEKSMPPAADGSG